MNIKLQPRHILTLFGSIIGLGISIYLAFDYYHQTMLNGIGMFNLSMIVIHGIRITIHIAALGVVFLIKNAKMAGRLLIMFSIVIIVTMGQYGIANFVLIMAAGVAGLTYKEDKKDKLPGYDASTTF